MNVGRCAPRAGLHRVQWVVAADSMVVISRADPKMRNRFKIEHSHMTADFLQVCNTESAENFVEDVICFSLQACVKKRRYDVFPTAIGISDGAKPRKKVDNFVSLCILH